MKPSGHAEFLSAVHLVLIRHNRALLMRRSRTGYEDGKLSLIAGHIEGKETALEAMQREAREEAQIEIKKDDLAFAHIMHRNAKDRERLDFFFHVTRWKGEPTIGEPDKCSEFVWVPIHRIPKDTIPYVAEALGHVRRGVTYSEFGWKG